MSNREKPILDTDGQIEHLKSKGIKFEIMSIEEAKNYLNNNNNTRTESKKGNISIWISQCSKILP